ncbi:MAG: VanR-ABDEGLN family response regulator transcription factor [Lachnospiraceae bacterium]|nr:VanR-ABDEGLN family response regulator transcription factor [Lachnospiraceae bacterium]
MPDRILIVDDEKEIADLIELYLKNEGYEVCKFYSSKEALACIESETLDMAVMDIMMPDITGFDLCRKIREKYNYPIIMLTAKDTEIDKITGLTLGADDYITKPFRPLEMMARVKAQLRRYKRYNMAASGHSADQEGETVIIHSGLVMNIKTHECFLNERPLLLTPTEFEILRILLEKKGNVVSAEELFHEIWKDEYYSKNNNTITVHIRHLREKMNETADAPRYIKTIWGVGYKIEN